MTPPSNSVRLVIQWVADSPESAYLLLVYPGNRPPRVFSTRESLLHCLHQAIPNLQADRILLPADPAISQILFADTVDLTDRQVSLLSVGQRPGI